MYWKLAKNGKESGMILRQIILDKISEVLDKYEVAVELLSVTREDCGYEISIDLSNEIEQMEYAEVGSENSTYKTALEDIYGRRKINKGKTFYV